MYISICLQLWNNDFFKELGDVAQALFWRDEICMLTWQPGRRGLVEAQPPGCLSSIKAPAMQPEEGEVSLFSP